MQDESIRDAPGEVEMEDHALLQLLMDERHVIWSMAELSSALNPRGSSVVAVDAVTRLEADGLVHRFGKFVFASRAASRAWRLQL